VRGLKKDAHAFNFCENGAKAVAFEATSKTVTPEFFAQHTVSWLAEQNDFYLEDLGRLTDPMRYDLCQINMCRFLGMKLSS
jgi:hypothetical protein